MSTPAVHIPSDVPTLPNLYDAVAPASPPRPALQSSTNEAEPRGETLLEPFEWVVSFDEDDDERTDPVREEEQALALDDEELVLVENLESGIRPIEADAVRREAQRLKSTPPPLPVAARPKETPAPPSVTPPRIMPPARSRFWSDD